MPQATLLAVTHYSAVIIAEKYPLFVIGRLQISCTRLQHFTTGASLVLSTFTRCMRRASSHHQHSNGRISFVIAEGTLLW